MLKNGYVRPFICYWYILVFLIFLGFILMVFIIKTNACQWAAPYHVLCLKSLLHSSIKLLLIDQAWTIFIIIWMIFSLREKNVQKNWEILMESFRKLCSQLEVPLAEDKTVGPVTLMTFLGFEIDTVLMFVKLHRDKLQKLKYQSISLMSKERIAITELESLAGLMPFCARAIVSDRAFIRRFYDLIASVKNAKPYYTVRINNEVKYEAEIWLQFLSNLNDECYMPEKFWTSNQSIELFTDSTGNESLGCASYFCGHWVQYQWPKQWSNADILADITCLELIPIILYLVFRIFKKENYVAY